MGSRAPSVGHEDIRLGRRISGLRLMRNGWRADAELGEGYGFGLDLGYGAGDSVNREFGST